MRLNPKGIVGGRFMRMLASEQLQELQDKMNEYVKEKPDAEGWTQDEAAVLTQLSTMAMMSLLTAICEYLDPMGQLQPPTDEPKSEGSLLN